MNITFLESVYGDIKQRYEETGGKGVGLIGVPFGFKQIDEDTGGMRNDSVNIIAARTSMGKTALVMSMILAGAVRGYRSAYLSLEMSERMMVLRFLSMLTGISPVDIEKGKLFTREQLENVRTAIDFLSKLPISIIDKGMNSQEIFEYFDKNHNDCDYYVIDHIGILRDPGDQYQKMTDIAHNVRNTARDLNKPIIAVAQLNRNVDGREKHIPQNSDLRDSGAIEENAELIAFPFRDNYYIEAGLEEGDQLKPGQPDTTARVFITKSRYSASGIAYPLWFYPHRTLWTDKTEPMRMPKAYTPSSGGTLAQRVRER